MEAEQYKSAIKFLYEKKNEKEKTKKKITTETLEKTIE